MIAFNRADRSCVHSIRTRLPRHLLALKHVACIVGVVGVCATITGTAQSQSLLRQPVPLATNNLGETDAIAPLREVSLFLVEAPKPKTIEVNDKVTIIISETSSQASKQKLDAKKDMGFRASLRDFPDLAALLDGRLENSASGTITAVDASTGQSFKGDGSYERSDRFTDRITATVLDVKPNGVLVVEARRTITKDKETQMLVLSGEVRREDVTENNTVLSSQLAELAVVVQNEGDVKDSATKGWITQFFETVFNF